MVIKKNNLRKKISILIAFIIILFISGVIYASTIEKTIITCNDNAMYEALKQALNDYIMFGDTDNNNLTIKIPTNSIELITTVNLDNKQIIDITGIEKLTNLSNISLAKNRITSIEPLNELNNIRVLNLNDNTSIGDLDSVLSTKTGITTLKISNTGISNINFIANLTALRELEIAKGSFSSLRPIENLSGLKKLDVSGNRSITTIESIIKMINLESLNISNTGINTLEINEDVEIGIYNLIHLKELYLSGLDLEDVYPIVKSHYVEEHHQDEDGNWEDAEVPFLLNLEVLDISYLQRNENTYVNFPDFSDLSILENLKKLYVQGNRLEDVSEIYKMRNLEEVNLKENEIKDLSGLVEIEVDVDDDGNEIENVISFINAKSIDLSFNEIESIDVFEKIPRTRIQYIDLSSNHIYNTFPIENTNATIRLQDQVINMAIYKKSVEIDQYIFLLPIMQNAKNESSKLYSENAEYITNGCTINTDSFYQSVGSYNVIIDKTKTEEDIINVTLQGGIADGTKIEYIITDDEVIGMDSLVFNDLNLMEKVENALFEVLEEDDYFLANGKLINVVHDVLNRVEKFDLSNSNISDLVSLENFDYVTEVNISDNKDINSIEPLKHYSHIQKLNASKTSIGSNILPLQEMTQLETLILNDIELTNIDSINNFIDQFDEYNDILLLDLDLSSNHLESIEGIERITSLEKLSVTNNNLTDVPDLSELTELEKLTLYANKLEKMPIISSTNNLEYVFLSDNNITDISELKKISSLIELDLSNNLLDNEDMKDIKDIRISKSLKIAGNNITDISNLRTSLSTLSELDISQNMIEDVSIIDSRFPNNGILDASSQKIHKIINQADENEVSIELPQIFKAAKTSTSRFYTTQQFELSNCILSGTDIIINLEELGEKTATVRIKGGIANDTLLIISTPIIANISYNTNEWTNSDVTSQISFLNRTNITIKNNNGSNQFVFKNNGEFEFEYVDDYGMEGSALAQVTWIDKEAPTITNISGINTQCLGDSGSATLRIEGATDGEGIGLDPIPYSFDNGENWQEENTKTYTENTEGIIIKVRDKLGNTYTHEEINIRNHYWNNGVVTKEATCEETGVKTYTCTVCGETKTESNPALGHEEVTDAAVAATCTKTGKTEGTHCARCNKILVAQEITPVLEHSYEAEVTQPTCTEGGYTTHTCTRCGNSYVDTYVEALGHTYENGKCTRCEEVEPEIEIRSNKYIVNRNTNQISKVSPKTTVKSFLDEIITSTGVTKKVYNHKGQEITNIENSYIGTGMKISLYKAGMEEPEELTVIVTGDIDGNGDANFFDMIEINKYRLKITELTNEKLIAGDINKDNKVDFFDMIEINKYRLRIRVNI